MNLVQLRKVLSILRAAEIIEIEANGSSLPVAMVLRSSWAVWASAA